MNFEGLKQRVERAELLVDGRILQTQACSNRFRQEWRLAWTPGRILIAGVATGFLVGRARPARMLKAVSATRWIQIATSLTGLFASLQAAWAAHNAEDAAQGAEAAAETAADTAEAVADDVAAAPVAAGPARVERQDPLPRSVSDGRRRPDPAWDSEPRPAEAATEVSER